MRFEAMGALRGEISLPGDKSICHRAVTLGAIAEGRTRIHNFSGGGDNRSTIHCLRAMGVLIDEMTEPSVETAVDVHGVGLHGLREPENVLDAGNSGTTMRMLAGLLAPQPFFSVVSGDEFLRRRPMRRVVEPLRGMGAEIYGREGDTKAPLAIRGRKLTGCETTLKVASAQVKSALILAGLFADGETTVIEPGPSRDHTERMLRYMGADVHTERRRITVRGAERLRGVEIQVPGDISSAAFFVVAALIVPGSEVLLKGVGVNPTRTGILDILRQMGGDIEILEATEAAGEPVADILVKHSPLKGVVIEGELVVRAIDEFPVLAVAATQAEGETRITGAEELRVKETDRIRAMTAELAKLGADIEELKDGLVVRGGKPLRSGRVESYHDHRIAMSLAVAAQVAAGSVEIADFDAVGISYPSFASDLVGLGTKR